MYISHCFFNISQIIHVHALAIIFSFLQSLFEQNSLKVVERANIHYPIQRTIVVNIYILSLSSEILSIKQYIYCNENCPKMTTCNTPPPKKKNQFLF